mgnify:CR=1 FL=1
MFITLEGPEGSGKTSHVAPLVEYLHKKGYTVFATREPGGTSIGEQIREVLHNLKNSEMHARTETLLYQAARAQFVEQVVRPRLMLGDLVISDRYADSTIAYQLFRTLPEAERTAHGLLARGVREDDDRHAAGDGVRALLQHGLDADAVRAERRRDDKLHRRHVAGRRRP